MKRLLCAVLLLCLVCSSAIAEIFDEFDIMAGVFGCNLFLESEKIETNGYEIYIRGDCKIAFKDERIIIDGKGEEFVPYCMAALMAIDTDTSAFERNAGLFLSRYLLARDGTEQYGQTVNGYTFLFTKSDNGLMFTIGK